MLTDLGPRGDLHHKKEGREMKKKPNALASKRAAKKPKTKKKKEAWPKPARDGWEFIPGPVDVDDT